MTLATHTLGCKLNFAETSHLQRQLELAGFEVVSYHERADVYVINTCTVTATACKKCRNAIRQAVALNPHAIVAVIGCFAQTDAEQIAKIGGVDIILGNDLKHRLPEMLKIENGELKIENIHTPVFDHPSKEGTGAAANFQFSPFTLQFHPAYSGDDRTRTFFKIQDGCDYFCSYCAIPFARGRSRSGTIRDTVAMAREIAAKGTREIVLTGVNTGTFGQQHGESFIDLLRQLDTIDGILRYRISSIEPNLITDELIDFVAASRAFLPHFHIPLQAGSDKVLRLMRRRYDTALYSSRLEHIRSVMPDACIAADVITGFNGEDDDTFAQSLAFIDSLPISYLHVFPYSDRPGTAALKMPDRVPVPIRKQRSHQLQELSNRKRHAFVQSQMGKERKVLWEHSPHPSPNGNVMQGWTDNYIRLQRPFHLALAGTVTTYTIENSTIVDNFACDD